MEIAGQIKGDLSIKKADYYPSTGEKICTAVLKVKVTRDEAVNFYGEWFDRVVFSGIAQDNDDLKVGFKSIKPAFVLEKHRITLLEKKLSVIPEIAKVTPIKDEDAVLIEVIIPLPIYQTMQTFYGELMLSAGSTVNVDFKRESPPLPGAEDENGTLTIVKGSRRSKGSYGPKSNLA